MKTCVEERIIFKWILVKQVLEAWNGFICLRIVSGEGHEVVINKAQRLKGMIHEYINEVI